MFVSGPGGVTALAVLHGAGGQIQFADNAGRVVQEQALDGAAVLVHASLHDPAGRNAAQTSLTRFAGSLSAIVATSSPRSQCGDAVADAIDDLDLGHAVLTAASPLLQAIGCSKTNPSARLKYSGNLSRVTRPRRMPTGDRGQSELAALVMQ